MRRALIGYNDWQRHGAVDVHLRVSLEVNDAIYAHALLTTERLVAARSKVKGPESVWLK